MTIYVSKEGHRLQRVEWMRLQETPDYKVVKEFDNGRLRATLYWPMYCLKVENYNAAGGLVKDPNYDGQTFPTEVTAIEGYEQFLVDWGLCERDEEGAFIEVDNALTPPPPPDPDAPTSTLPSLPQDFSAW
jgi:hypothetical protein